jgi:hypothetical protein
VVGLFEDETGDDTENRKDFDERKTDVHKGLQLACSFWLTTDALNGLAKQNAKADAWANRCKAVTHGVGVSAEDVRSGEDCGQHCWLSLLL